jgi:predicted transcriptional regulator
MGRRQYSEWTWPENGVFRLLEWSNNNRLGPLELRVLSVLWQRGSATVWEVIEYGDIRREYNTVMTTLDRLYKKRLVGRTVGPNSRAFHYFPRHRTQAEWQRELVIDTVKQVLGMDTTALLPLSCLVEAVSEYEVGLLDDLRRLARIIREHIASAQLLVRSGL